MAKDRRDEEGIRRIGENLRAARHAQDMSQDDLARRCDLHVTEISRIERGVRDPRASTILEAARGLGVPAAALLAGL